MISFCKNARLSSSNTISKNKRFLNDELPQSKIKYLKKDNDGIGSIRVNSKECNTVNHDLSFRKKKDIYVNVMEWYKIKLSFFFSKKVQENP